MISVLLWISLEFLIKVVVTLFFAAVGGVGLAAGFDFYKKLKASWESKRNIKKNKAYLDQLEQEELGGCATSVSV